MGLLSSLQHPSYTSQAYLPKNSTTHSRLGPPPYRSNQENSLKTYIGIVHKGKSSADVLTPYAFKVDNQDYVSHEHMTRTIVLSIFRSIKV